MLRDRSARVDAGKNLEASPWTDVSCRGAVASTPPTPLPKPVFASPELDSEEPQEPTPRRLFGAGSEDVKTPCRVSASITSAEQTLRPPQIFRRPNNAIGLLRGNLNNQPQPVFDEAAPVPASPRSHPAQLQQTPASHHVDPGHALGARLSVGLMGCGRHVSELQRFLDSHDAALAPLQTFETLVIRLQAAEVELSGVRAVLEGRTQRENVCATLLRQADKKHALAEARRLQQRTPEVRMLASNLLASVAAVSNACLKQLRPTSGKSLAPPPTAALDASSEAAVRKALHELSSALSLFDGCAGVSASAASEHADAAREASAPGGAPPGGAAMGGAMPRSPSMETPIHPAAPCVSVTPADSATLTAW